jgi:hypothetical protein
MLGDFGTVFFFQFTPAHFLTMTMLHSTGVSSPFYFFHVDGREGN